MSSRFDASQVKTLIDSLVDQIAQAYPAGKPLNIVGIRTGGEHLASRLTAALQARGYAQIGRGTLDITLYRDDLSEVGPRPLVRPTHITINLDATPLILVDDVLYTGRSVRAALDLLADYGRPSAIRLAVLVNRPGRELPIQPDFTALSLPATPPIKHVNVRLTETDQIDEILVEHR